MKYVFLILMFSFSFGQAQDREHWNGLGLGLYRVAVQQDGIDDINLKGFSLNYSLSFTNWMAVKVEGYKLSDDDLDVTGGEASMLFGWGLRKPSFRIYGKVGYFSEQWDIKSNEERFGGLQLGIGIGATFKWADVNLWVAGRDSSDYEEKGGLDTTAGSAGLGVAFRF